jgi:hypothetical protein
MIRIRIREMMLGLLCTGGLGGAIAAGKVSDGVYFSPLNNFTIPVPNWRGLKIQDRNDDDFAIVSFLDRGDFPAAPQSIATLRLTADVEPIFLDPSKRDAAIQGFLTGFVVPNLFQNVSPQTAIVHGEFLDEGERRLHFAVAHIPEGHAFLRNPKKGKQEDSVSGLLIFHNRGFMYMVRVEMKTLFNVGLNPSSLSPKDLESAQKSLLRIMGTMKFAN